MSCRDVVKVSKTTFILLSEIRNFILDFISPKLFQAVELDDLSPVDDLVKHSSSAVDIRTVLMQVIFTIQFLPDEKVPSKISPFFKEKIS